MNLGTQIGPAPDGGWGLPGSSGQFPADTMTSINSYFTMVFDDDSRYEDLLSIGGFAKFDESRIYSRVLSDAEICGLYNHPGGQKRTENPMEPERQVAQP